MGRVVGVWVVIQMQETLAPRRGSHGCKELSMPVLPGKACCNTDCWAPHSVSQSRRSKWTQEITFLTSSQSEADAAGPGLREFKNRFGVGMVVPKSFHTASCNWVPPFCSWKTETIEEMCQAQERPG